MNYQSNMGVYYTYNQNKNKEAARKKRNLLLTSLLILLMLLLFAWVSFNYFDQDSLTKSIPNKSVDSKSDTSKETNIKTKEEALSLKVTNDLDTKVNTTSQEITKPSHILDQELGLFENTTPATLATKELNTSTKSILKITNTVVQDLNKTKENTLPIGTGTLLLVNNELNTSIKNNLATTETTNKELNSTKEESKDKVVVEKKLPLVMYHLYIVSAGETISSIAKTQYDDPSMSIEIIQANPDLENPNNIKEGQEILLPIVDESKSYSDILHFK